MDSLLLGNAQGDDDPNKDSSNSQRYRRTLRLSDRINFLEYDLGHLFETL